MRTLSVIAAVVALVLQAGRLDAEDAAGFAGFASRAAAGGQLSVVFFGCSLTWGANASDQDNTSYRALVRDRLEERYPAARFHCHDASIGGTNSQLGVFRLERDVLRWHPDLVFVDFTANDGITSGDPETLASYEAILRRLAASGVAVVQVAFPFRWDIARAALPGMQRLAAHRALAESYGNGWGDAVTAIIDAVEAKTTTLDAIWVADGVHPYDLGYRLFADAAWGGFLQALADRKAPRVPAASLHAATYQSARRVRLATLGPLPEGWRPGDPERTAVNHDWLMSRWQDGLAVARNRTPAPTGAQQAPTPCAVAPLRLRVAGAAIMLFGEATPGSGRFRARIDGVAVTGQGGQEKGSDLFEANRWKTGNGFLWVELARGLDPAVAHLVEIEPVFAADQDQELRLESVCVAGGKAEAELAR